jgi:hypothetical protein
MVLLLGVVLEKNIRVIWNLSGLLYFKTEVRVKFDVSYQETYGQCSGESNEVSSGENRRENVDGILGC